MSTNIIPLDLESDRLKNWLLVWVVLHFCINKFEDLFIYSRVSLFPFFVCLLSIHIVCVFFTHWVVCLFLVFYGRSFYMRKINIVTLAANFFFSFMVYILTLLIIFQ